MAEKRRFLDVWIVESNNVYREVPFAVVTDWLQQGRLLADDKVKPSGTAEWFLIGGMPALSPFLPKMEEHRAEDQAEALEKVEIDFTWKPVQEPEDEDVDMIPLIDVSLVLLIFFMMTATVSGGLFDIDTPSARNRNVVLSEDMKLWVGISSKREKGGAEDVNRPWYSFGISGRVVVEPVRDRSQFLALIKKKLEEEIDKNAADAAKSGAKLTDAQVSLRLRADQKLPIEIVKAASADLKSLERALKIKSGGRVQIFLFGEVSEPQE